MKKLKILSIDFDFFQDVDAETLMKCYPDGIDLPTDITKITWGGRYSDRCPYKDKIQAVKINQSFFKQMLNILKKQNKDIPVMIMQSHKHIYNFIHDNAEKQDDLFVVNVDLHHDVTNDNDEVDCGNWISHIGTDFPNSTFCWITREVSFECYEIDFSGHIPAYFDFDKIKDMDFDAIFICRSDSWLPPHLDKHFNKMLNVCGDTFDNVICENCVLTPRDISDIIRFENEIFEDYENKAKGEIQC